MKVSELKAALAKADDNAEIVIKSEGQPDCGAVSIHVGAGGEATVTIECGPGGGEIEPDADDMGGDADSGDMIDQLAAKAGVDTGKKKPAPAPEAE